MQQQARTLNQHGQTGGGRSSPFISAQPAVQQQLQQLDLQGHPPMQSLGTDYLVVTAAPAAEAAGSAELPPLPGKQITHTAGHAASATTSRIDVLLSAIDQQQEAEGREADVIDSANSRPGPTDDLAAAMESVLAAGASSCAPAAASTQPATALSCPTAPAVTDGHRPRRPASLKHRLLSQWKTIQQQAVALPPAASAPSTAAPKLQPGAGAALAAMEEGAGDNGEDAVMEIERIPTLRGWQALSVSE